MARLFRGGRLVGIRRDRREHLLSVTIGHQHDPAFAVLVEEAPRDPAEALEIPVTQRIGQRQHLQRAGHAQHLGIEDEADAADGFQHPLGRVLPVLLVIVVDHAGCENDQRQRGSRDQKGETHWQ